MTGTPPEDESASIKHLVAQMGIPEEVLFGPRDLTDIRHATEENE